MMVSAASAPSARNSGSCLRWSGPKPPSTQFTISAYYQIEPDHIVVIHDDMDLDFGRIKVKAGGSAGGHNGIKSIDRSGHEAHVVAGALIFGAGVAQSCDQPEIRCHNNRPFLCVLACSRLV